MCLAVGSGGTVLKFTGLGSSPLVSPLTGNQHSDRHPQRLHADTASSCSIFTSSIGAQTADGGSTFSQISAVPPLANGSVNAASCGGSGSALQWAALLRRTLETGYALVLATNGISSPTFEPSALLPSESFGGPDGSRPCFACALKAAKLSAQGFAAEPINTSDGDFYESVPIVSIPGKGPSLSFTATYDSDLAYSKRGGKRWVVWPPRVGLERYHFMNLTGAGGGGNITLNEEGGAEITYVPVSTGPGFDGATCTTGSGLQCYVAAEGDVTAVMEGTPLAGTYTFSRADGGKTQYDFSSSGLLSAITDSNNYTETFGYGVTGGTNCSTSGTKCDTETDAEGRVLDIVYTVSTGLVSEIVDPSGRTWVFSWSTLHEQLELDREPDGQSVDRSRELRLRHGLLKLDDGAQHDVGDVAEWSDELVRTTGTASRSPTKSQLPRAPRHSVTSSRKPIRRDLLPPSPTRVSIRL